MSCFLKELDEMMQLASDQHSESLDNLGRYINDDLTDSVFLPEPEFSLHDEIRQCEGAPVSGNFSTQASSLDMETTKQATETINQNTQSRGRLASVHLPSAQTTYLGATSNLSVKLKPQQFTTKSCFNDKKVEDSDTELDIEPASDSETKSLKASTKRLASQFPESHVLDLRTVPQILQVIHRLIDEEPITVPMVENLSKCHKTVFFNFANLLYNVSPQSSEEYNLQPYLDQIMIKMVNSESKKIRNEERIKYIFKRVNKILLKSFIRQKNLESYNKSIAKGLMIQYYFSGAPLPSKISDAEPVPSSDKRFKRVFSQTGVSRNELKALMHSSFYKVAVSQVVDNILEHLISNRNKKTMTIVDKLIDKLFSSVNREEVTALRSVVKRVPWSVKEMIQSIGVFKSLVLGD